MNRMVFVLIILLLVASPAYGAGCKEAVEKETQSWLEDCKAKCEKKLTCGCAVTAAIRKRAVYWPSCLAAVASMKPSTVERTWKGHWIRKGPEAPAARLGGATPEPDDGLFNNPPPQILANCEIGFYFTTKSGGTYRFWQENAGKLKPSAWGGACIDGKSTASLYQATGRGTVDFGLTGSDFTGEFRNGQAWNGQGVFWSKRGFRFEGELRNGEPWNGKETSRFAPEKNTEYRNGTAVKAVSKDDPLKPFGPNWIIAENQPCQVYNPNPVPGETVTWSGECAAGKAFGKGRLVYRSNKGTHTYEGEFFRGQLHGRGTFTWPSGERYEGEYREGKKNGRGIFTWSSGNRYEGEFRDGKWHGRGTYTLSNGNRYDGDFRDGKRHGRGTLTVSSGDRYEGDFRDGKAHGRGTVTTAKSGHHAVEARHGCVSVPNVIRFRIGATRAACGFR